MMMRWGALALIVVVLVAWGAWSGGGGREVDEAKEEGVTRTQEKREYQARFEIYTRGTKRVFTDPRYHQLSPDVFITKDEPSVIMVKRVGVTWGEFFATLPMSVTNECLITGTGQKFCNSSLEKLKFFLNGVEQEVLNREIQGGDKLVIRYENKIR